MNKITKYLKSKTVWFGSILVALGAIQTYLPQIQTLISADTYSIATAAIGVVVIVLRAVTSTSLNQK